MKHYTDAKGLEWQMFNEVRRDREGLKPKTRDELKRGYRGRERAALKRMTAELVEGELTVGDDERRFWERRYEEARMDWYDLESAEYRLRQSGRWRDEQAPIFAAAYREVRERTEAAFAEWRAAA